MIEDFLPLFYAGIAGFVIAVGLKVYGNIQREKLRLAARAKFDTDRPEAAVDQFMNLIATAPQMLETAKVELQKIRDKNPSANLKDQEQEIKWLETLARYQKPLMIVAPILGPIAKRYVKGLSRSL